MTHIYFVRHAHPNYQTHDDASRELSAKGKKDCAIVSEFFRDKTIDVVLSSPFKRAKDTVEATAKEHGLDIRYIDDFRERKISDDWIEDFETYCRRQWADFSYKLEGGESLQEVLDRNKAALTAVLKAYEGKSVVIGGHGTAISTLLYAYDSHFGRDGFQRVRRRMPWVVEFIFDGERFVSVQSHVYCE